MRRTGRLAAGALLAAIATGGGATAAQAATLDDPGTVWDSAAVTFEYGDYWQLSATAPNGDFIFDPWVASGSLSGVPSGYAPAFGVFHSGTDALAAYVSPDADARPLGAGSYGVTLTLTELDSSGTSYNAPPATLTIAPAALTMTLAVTADPSNPTNAIISGELTGHFRENFFTSTYPFGPLGPAGTWTITVEDEAGEVVHEASVDRTDTDDIMGVSSYWSGVAPGTYTVQGTFTATGGSASNFAITNPSPVSYTAAPAPGATSTATPAPPAPPPADEESGMTLPGWIPLVAGVLSAGLLALLIVQIVRLRRAAVPSVPGEGSAA